MSDGPRRSGGRWGVVWLCVVLVASLASAPVARSGGPALGSLASDLDPTFGGGGIARLPLPSWTGMYCANRPLVDGQGRVYVVSCWQEELSSYADLLIARFTADGDLDATFGDDGRVALDISSPYYIIPHDATFDAQGRIVIAARDLTSLAGYRMTVVRVLADGSLDASFDDDGVSRFVALPNGPTIDDDPVYLGLDDAGRIVMAGSARDGTGAPDDFFAARLTAAGDLDATFSGDGRVSVATGFDFPAAVMDDAGRLIGAVGSGVSWQADGTHLFRLLPNATGLDPTFGDDGVTVVDLDPTESVSGKADAIALDSAGRIIVSGQGDFDDGPGMFIARFLPDGSLDDSFGEGGVATYQRLVNGIADTLYPHDIATYPDGRVVVGGEVDRVWVNARDQFVIRLTAAGALDGSFSGDGVAITDTYPGTSNQMNALAKVTIDGSSRILTSDGAGLTDTGRWDYITVSRYLAASDGPVGPTPGDPRFIDTAGSTFAADIDWLAEEGITRGCNPPADTKFCPDDFVTRGQMAAFLVRALGYTDDGGGDLFVDDDASVFEGDIDRLGTAGVTRGCNPPADTKFCPDDFVTRGQMAAFLVRALGYTDDGGGDLFVDDDASVFEGDIDRLGTAGVTRGCNPPADTKFCPDDFVTRGQMAAFLHRALGSSES